MSESLNLFVFDIEIVIGASIFQIKKERQQKMRKKMFHGLVLMIVSACGREVPEASLSQSQVASHLYCPLASEKDCKSFQGSNDRESAMKFGDAFVFPLSGPAQADYTEAPRSFGSCRDNCNRRHAAADLYTNTGTIIHAVADGEIIDFYEFYLGTYALVIDHGDFVVRYGEIKGNLPQGMRIGARVKQGRGIAYVGRLNGLNQDMLHFERFAGWARGPLTDTGNYPFQRRRDLVNPTQDLIAWKYPQ